MKRKEKDLTPNQTSRELPSLKLAAKAPENRPSQGPETSIPTIHFLGRLLLLVLGKCIFQPFGKLRQRPATCTSPTFVPLTCEQRRSPAAKKRKHQKKYIDTVSGFMEVFPRKHNIKKYIKKFHGTLSENISKMLHGHYRSENFVIFHLHDLPLQCSNQMQ